MKQAMILLFILVCTSNSFGYYMPEQGRWLSRDPVNEEGFKKTTIISQGNTKTKNQPVATTAWGTDRNNSRSSQQDKLSEIHNLYRFVRNSAISFVDFLGLEVEICIRPVDRKLPPPSWWLIVHSFFKTDKCGNWGYFPEKGPNPKVPKGGGVVPEQNPGGTAGTASRCVEVKCPCLDEDKLCDEIAKSKADPVWAGSKWKRVRHNCAHWTDMILKSQGCKGMEDHFPSYTLPSPNPKY